MTRTGFFTLMVSLALFCSCTGKGPDDGFLRTPTEYSLSVKGRTVFSSNPYTSQTSANLKKNEYDQISKQSEIDRLQNATGNRMEYATTRNIQPSCCTSPSVSWRGSSQLGCDQW